MVSSSVIVIIIFYFIFHPDSLANYHNRALVTSSFLNYIIIMIIIIVWIKLLTILPGVQRDIVLPLLLFLRSAAACQLYQPFLLLYSFCFLIFSNTDALIVITVYLRDITKSSPVHSNILLRNSSTHPIAFEPSLTIYIGIHANVWAV